MRERVDETIYRPHAVTQEIVFWSPLLNILFCFCWWVAAAIMLTEATQHPEAKWMFWASMGLFAIPPTFFIVAYVVLHLKVKENRDELLVMTYDSMHTAELRMRPPPRNVGYVYLIRNPAGLVKIGRSQNPNIRLRSLMTGSVDKLELLHTIECQHPHAIERALHRTYSGKRVRGEWFKLTDEDIESIKQK
ncbi:MAG: GIY-YIG nuclease family protein [Blastocatellia bacterium]|nr:GIY-YIG nuclease family protein [Blastocatellia bacterium]